MTSRGGGRPSSTRSTSAASPTPTATAWATSPGSAAACRTSAGLGVDALWLTPCYPSPQADAGYDVADYRDIDPRFGTLADMDAPARRRPRPRAARDRRPRPQPHERRAPVVPRRPRGRQPGSAERGRYLFRDGRGPQRRAPAERLAEHVRRRRRGRASPSPTGRPASGTSTCSTPSSPTSTGPNEEVRAEFRSILRFWLDRGVDGFRIDVAHGLAKDPALPDVGDVHPPTARRRRRPAIRTGTRTRSTTSTGSGVGSATATTASGRSSARRGSPRPSAWPATSGPTSCTRPSTSSSCSPVGRRRAARRPSTAASTRSPRSARRRRGCCRTTTSCAT